MSLAALLREQFDPGTRQRGHVRFADGGVTIDEADDDYVSAYVRGTARYEVSLHFGDGCLDVFCSCPYFGDRGPCKHVWATILAADAEGLLQPGPEVKSLFLDGGVGAIEDDETDEDDGHRISRLGFPDEDVFAHVMGRMLGKPRRPSWPDVLGSLANPLPADALPGRPAVPVVAQLPGQELMYVIEGRHTLSGQGLTLTIMSHSRRKDGQWGAARSFPVDAARIDGLREPIDREIVALIMGSDVGYQAVYDCGNANREAQCRLRSQTLQEKVLPMMLATGRCWLRMDSDDEPMLLDWDNGPPWAFRIEVSRDEQRKQYVVRGVLVRGDERKPLAEPLLLIRGGWVFWNETADRLDAADAFHAIVMLRQAGEVRVPLKEAGRLLAALHQGVALPLDALPDELRVETVTVRPRPRLAIQRPRLGDRDRRLQARVTFDYAGRIVDPELDHQQAFLDPDRRLLRRDPITERMARDRLAALGLRPTAPRYGDDPPLEFATRNLGRVVTELLAEDWHVEAQGKAYRRAGGFNLRVTTGVDWFELHGRADFDGAGASLPVLLTALRKGERIVPLDDGTVGLLPEDWLAQIAPLAALGDAAADHIRFRPNQAGLLDALLAAQPEAAADEAFERLRAELRGFQSIAPAEAPAGFNGTLRPYQREGLGWLGFLRRFRFGGCLADDMGLGKTVQVLAMLEARRRERLAAPDGGAPPAGPSIAVVPRSLVFNWLEEARRFTPDLRVLNAAGVDRPRDTAAFDACDLVLVTYGTLRRDIVRLKDYPFDWVILDEAQAIKNADAATTKATRLLDGRHRLALSGTPIQNHLGDLWSLFEFLNPGMLGRASVLQLAGRDLRVPEEATRALLSRALRPFILRRTKGQVARELPERLEETLVCELEGPQRKLYNELRDHYRRSLLARVESEGLARSKIQVLEALLRLRQAACHPGLIDPDRGGEASAKLDVLLAQLADVREEGHKALVFSQFTSMLAIVRNRLDAEQIPYAYLDGQTADREAAVRQFQDDPGCQLFLISLKAGGLGLNLTAAEYVFLLDPWWNPAVEAQAIDRAHRIGQTRRVFAYRLIARDTVEEKVVALQQTKRELADAIIGADNSLIRDLRREDLELLLG